MSPRKKVEDLAYMLWLDAGSPDGMSEVFWKRAERIVLRDELRRVVDVWIEQDDLYPDLWNVVEGTPDE